MFVKNREGTKLLSVCVSGRNDDYGGKFKERLQLAVNYFTRNAEIIGCLEKCEIVITDWASEIPLSKSLQLTYQAARITRFIYVEPEQAEKYSKADCFNTTAAINAGLFRAYGKYHAMMPADILITSWALKNLLDILADNFSVPFSPSQSIILIKRYFIPSQYREGEKSFSEIDEYLFQTTQYMDSSSLHPGLGMDAGIICNHRNITFDVGGYDETMPGWGKSDTNFCLRAGYKYPLINLSGYGVHCYDFMPSSGATNNKNKRKNKSKDIAFNSRNKNWGLKREFLSEQKCEIVEEYICKTVSVSDMSEAVDDLLTSDLMQSVVDALSFNNLVVETSYYFIAWYLRNFDSKTFVEFLPSDPSSYCGIREPDCSVGDCGAVTVVSSLNPSASIYSIFTESKKNNSAHNHRILSQQYLNKHGGKLGFFLTLIREIFPPQTHKHKWMSGFAHQFHKGNVRLLTGPEVNSVSRLKKFIMQFAKIDICLIGGNSVKDPLRISRAIWPLLRSEGMIIYKATICPNAQDYKRLICRELGGCYAFVLMDTVIVIKDAQVQVCEFLENHRPELTVNFRGHLRFGAYFKSYFFDFARFVRAFL